MSIYKPSELRQFLLGLGINPKKVLSQNFLIDGNIIQKIVSAAEVEPGDVVLEVGPGPGALTEALLAAGATVVAVEKDDVLSEALKRLQTADNRLHVFNEDIMEFDLEGTLRGLLKSGQKAKVIANLPYHLTTPILAHFIKCDTLLLSVTVMVQEEVARRITSQPGTSEYSSFTIFLDFYSTPRYSFTVSNNCFYPVPRVKSAVIRLDLHRPPEVKSEEDFFILTRSSFEQRRKMLRSSLRDLYEPQKVMDALSEIGKSPIARPEELSLEDFIRLFDLLNK